MYSREELIALGKKCYKDTGDLPKAKKFTKSNGYCNRDWVYKEFGNWKNFIEACDLKYPEKKSVIDISSLHNMILRDDEGVAHIVAISGGKDSTCLALALKEKEPRPYNYMFTPTVDELPEMVEHMKKLEQLLDAPIISLTNGNLNSIIKENKMIPTFYSRFCTRILKLRPASEFYSALDPVVAYVGIRNDEDERAGMRPGRDSASIKTNISNDFPFQRWEWDEEDVWSYLNDKGVSIPKRTDCARCPFQKLGEWYNLWKEYPLIYHEAEIQEEHYEHTFRSAQRDTWPAGLKELRERFEEGEIPTISLRMMEERDNMCRVCSL